MATSTKRLKILVLLSALATAPGSGVPAASERSLSDSEIEVAEAKVTVQRVTEENRELKERIALAEAANAKLTESLALATGEAEVYRRQTAELKLRLEALGVDGASGVTGLQERFAKALNNLRLSEEDRKRISVALIGLNEAIVQYLKTASNSVPEARLALEKEMRHASESLGKGNPSAAEAPAASATLEDAMVVEINDQLGPLVVANVGSKHGVRSGMPFQIIRDNQLVGTLRVIDVRERICGAVIQNLTSEKDKVRKGDRLRVAAQL